MSLTYAQKKEWAVICVSALKESIAISNKGGNGSTYLGQKMASEAERLKLTATDINFIGSDTVISDELLKEIKEDPVVWIELFELADLHKRSLFNVFSPDTKIAALKAYEKSDSTIKLKTLVNSLRKL